MTVVYAVDSSDSYERASHMRTHIPSSDIDPVPLDHFTLPEVVALLAAETTIRDIEMAPPPAALQALFGPLQWIGSGTDCGSLAVWMKREQAIVETTQAIADGSLPAVVWDARMQAFVRLLPEDWRQAAFQDQMVRGGVIRSSAGERIGRYEGGRPLIDKAAVFERLSRKQGTKPPPAARNAPTVGVENARQFRTQTSIQTGLLPRGR